MLMEGVYIFVYHIPFEYRIGLLHFQNNPKDLGRSYRCESLGLFLKKKTPI